MNVHGYRRKSDPPAVEPRREVSSGGSPEPALSAPAKATPTSLSGQSSRRGEPRGSGPLSESSSGGGERAGVSAPLSRIHSSDWQQEASCVGMSNPDLFFPARGGKFSKEVRRLCDGCPVWRECLKYAHASVASWTFGYWGGLTDVERKGKSLQEAIALAESRRVEKAS